MRINLRAVDTRVISLASDADRRAHMVQLCRRLDLSFGVIEAIRCDPGWVGCGLSHVKALRAATPLTPLLLLEDDVDVTSAYAPEIEVPDDADAVYLGISSFGVMHDLNLVGTDGGVAAEAHDDTFLRIHNMMGSHAILYLSDRYRAAAADAMVGALCDLGAPPDTGLALAQASHRVYAVRQPFFYQAGALQPADRAVKQESATTKPVPEYALGTVLTAMLPGNPTNLFLAREGDTLVWRRVEPAAQDG